MFETIIKIIFTPEFGYSILRVMTPILLTAMGAIVADKAGVNNIGLEGTMLFASLTGVLGSAFSGSVFIGVLCAVLTGMLISFIMAYFALTLKTNLTLTGIALNLMASGGTIFILYVITGQKGTSDSLVSGSVPRVDLPFIKNIPVIGEIFSGHNILTYVALLSVFLVWFLLYKTTLGLRIRAVGESPEATETVGISVNKIQYISLIISGAMAGLGGAYMSMGYVNFFSQDMTAGRGFIALAAKAMGQAEPIGTFITSLIFGIADALGNNLQILQIPPELILMLPYIATIVGLIIFSLKDNKKVKKLKDKETN